MNPTQYDNLHTQIHRFSLKKKPKHDNFMQVGQCLNKASKSDVKPPKHIRPGLIPLCKYTQLLARNPGMCLHSQPHNLMNVYSS